MRLAVEIFRAGRHVSPAGEAFHFGERELDEAARAYDVRVHEAPLVVGHPKEDDEPSYGWAQGLTRVADILEADFSDVDERLVPALTLREFSRVSPSFYRPTSPNNPTPGRWHLRYVALLGIDKPTIRGLREASFSERARCSFHAAAGDVLSFDFTERSLRIVRGDDFDPHHVAHRAQALQENMLRAGKFMSTVEAVNAVLRSHGYRR